MNLIKNLSIRNKLLLISIAPFLAMVFYLVSSLREEMESNAQINEVLDDVVVVEGISSVMHELQLERGIVFRYLSDPEAYEQSEVLESQRAVDNKIREVELMLGKQMMVGDNQLLKELSERRKKIGGGADAEEVYKSYHAIIGSLIDDVNRISESTKIPEIKELLQNHIFLLYTREYLGRIRSRLFNNIRGGRFTDFKITEFASLVGRYEMSLEKFRRNAPESLVVYYDQSLSSPLVLQALQIIDSVLYDPTFADFAYTGADWWTSVSAYVDLIRVINERSADNIVATAEARQEVIRTSITTSILIGLVIVALVIVLVFYVTRLISESVSEIKDAADSISRGETDYDLKILSRDEIGDLAISFSELINKTKEFAGVAEKIGKGDYSSDVPLRGEYDTLGLALRAMKTNLLKLSQESERRTWLLKGNAGLNDRLRGEKKVKLLAQDVISYLVEYTEAGVGAIYLQEDDSLVLAGSYAFYYRKGNKNVIRYGEGLVGQAAVEKKPIVFSEVPEDYIRISSGLGNATPKNIIVCPFLYNDEVKGVIEMGSVNAFSDLHLQFIDEVIENVGIAFNAAQSRDQLKELLEETQRQAEELEAQQEELRQSNEELREKTDLLEQSESELRAQQEELQQTNEELEEKANLLEEQKQNLEEAKLDVESKARELEVTSKYKSEFLANMSHELRTPLNSILILAQLLSENKSETLGEKEVEFSKNIYSSGTDLLNLINEILDLSKVEAGKIELELSQVRVEEMIGHLKNLFDETAAAKAIEFAVDVEDNKLSQGVWTDSLRLEQILRNLLSNAFKFTEKGGKVRMGFSVVDSGDFIMNEALRQLPEILAITVRDTGIGIPDDKQSLIFEAFQQADGSTKRKYGGTGLGLSISRELASALGGEIHLESKVGEGSTFTIYLPLKFDQSLVREFERKVAISKRQTPAWPDKTAVTKPVKLEKVEDDRYSLSQEDKLVLIIEDDPSFSKLLRDFIRERGYKAIIAQQGNTGLSLARHYRPQAVILDMKLPVMDGSEILRHLKNDPELRHIPVQIISGYDTRKEGLELGGFNFLRKPIDHHTLQASFDRIEEFISRKLKKLLIIEDDELQNSAIRELIGNGGIQSYSAYTGAQALQMINSEQFDCLIIDLGLPDMSGFKLLEEIRKEATHDHLPIIVYTGRELDKKEAQQLDKLASTVVLKTADSVERLLDETILFLHQVESQLPKEKQSIIRKLHRTDEVLKNKKVLIADDDMRNIYSITNVLEEEGVQCVTAENGKEAIALLKKNPDVDIILMDVMMPEMDGLEATVEIRKMSKFLKLPIIALTAKAMKGDREECLKAGMSDYIAKPVNVDKLLSLMRVWLYN